MESGASTTVRVESRPDAPRGGTGNRHDSGHRSFGQQFRAARVARRNLAHARTPRTRSAEQRTHLHRIWPSAAAPQCPKCPKATLLPIAEQRPAGSPHVIYSYSYVRQRQATRRRSGVDCRVWSARVEWTIRTARAEEATGRQAACAKNGQCAAEGNGGSVPETWKHCHCHNKALPAIRREEERANAKRARSLRLRAAAFTGTCNEMSFYFRVRAFLNALCRKWRWKRRGGGNSGEFLLRAF